MMMNTPGIDELENARRERYVGTIRAETALNDSVRDRVPERPRPLFREIPAGEAFPVNSLGPLLAGAAEAIHDKIQAPLSLCAQGVLATATLAVQGQRNVMLPYGASRPLS